jgi:hypothetical protein
MADMMTYPLGTPAGDTRLVGTEIGVPQNEGPDLNLTRNFTIEQCAPLINQINLGYTVYVARLNAGAGAVPTVNILQNTTGLTFVWTRSGAGIFVGTVAGTPLVQNKFWAQIGAKVPELPGIVWLTTNTVRINNVNSSNAAAVDGIQEAYLEIRLYS